MWLRCCMLAALLWGGLSAPATAQDIGMAATRERTAEAVERGRYLTRIGNCAGCHTAPGGEPFAGGLALESDPGTFHTPNITPDAESGIGSWSRDDLWAALHFGERPDGSDLYPACPYPNLTRLSRADVDAIYAYLQTVPAVANETAGHELAFPFGFRGLLGIWKALYFEPGSYEPRPDKGKAWNRGAYLVEGLGHCSACHRQRNFMGAVSEDPAAGGAMVHGWYAPPLHDSGEAGLQEMPVATAADFLRTGNTGNAVMMGPMAGVVFASLQHLSAEDATAMATYLAGLRDFGSEPAATSGPAETLDGKLSLGRRVYDDSCEDCHGESGQGAEGIVALAGNPGVTVGKPANVVNIIRRGGFAASVPGHARPHGMPPHYELTAREVAAVATYIRQSWGNRAPAVFAFDVDGR